MWEDDKILKALEEDSDWGAKKTLSNGVPVYYRDDEFPGEKIKEYPNGKRFIVITNGRTETIVREIPPRGEVLKKQYA